MREVEAQQGMQVFMHKEATEEQIQKLQEEINNLENVAKDISENLHLINILLYYISLS
mgnify:CR=1 FL=1